MAGASDNPSRRDVLGAAVAIPAVGLGSFDTRSRQARSLLRTNGTASAWGETLSAYRAAEAAVEEAGRVCAVASPEEIGAAEDAFGDRLEALYDQLRRLLVVPAPDVAALLVKVDAAFEHEIGTLAGTDASIAAVRGDVRRLGEAVTN